MAERWPVLAQNEPSYRHIEGGRDVIAETLRRQRLSDAEVARELRVDCSYFSKVRRGERPLTDPLLDGVTELLRLGRRRLAMAVEVMDRSELYFDASVRNSCYYAHTLLANMVGLRSATGDILLAMILAALSRVRCERLAHRAIERLATQAASFAPFRRSERAA